MLGVSCTSRQVMTQDKYFLSSEPNLSSTFKTSSNAYWVCACSLKEFELILHTWEILRSSRPFQPFFSLNYALVLLVLLQALIVVLQLGLFGKSLYSWSVLCLFSTGERGESKWAGNIAQHERHLYITEVSTQIWKERRALRWDGQGRLWNSFDSVFQEAASKKLRMFGWKW